jgi:hypothetical protein
VSALISIRDLNPRRLTETGCEHILLFCTFTYWQVLLETELSIAVVTSPFLSRSLLLGAVAIVINLESRRIRPKVPLKLSRFWRRAKLDDGRVLEAGTFAEQGWLCCCVVSVAVFQPAA